MQRVGAVAGRELATEVADVQAPLLAQAPAPRRVLVRKERARLVGGQELLVQLFGHGGRRAPHARRGRTAGAAMSGRRPEVTGRRPAYFRRATTAQRPLPRRRLSGSPRVGPRCHGGGGQGGGSGLRAQRERRRWWWRRQRRLPGAAVAGRGGGDGPRPAGSRQGDLPPPAERYGPALGLLTQGGGSLQPFPDSFPAFRCHVFRSSLYSTRFAHRITEPQGIVGASGPPPLQPPDAVPYSSGTATHPGGFEYLQRR